MGKTSKDKGKAGEREVVKLFHSILRDTGLWDTSTIGRNHQQAEKGGSDLVNVPYFSVEVKWHAQPPGPGMLNMWWYQAYDQALEEDKEPLLVYRCNRGRWFVMMIVCPYKGHEYVRGVIEWDVFASYLLARLRG